jgi:NADH:ubiquinone oxidoreductase subunit H
MHICFMEFTDKMKTNKLLFTPRIWFIILLSLLVMTLTWVWFDRKINAIDTRIEMLNRQ